MVNSRQHGIPSQKTIMLK